MTLVGFFSQYPSMVPYLIFMTIDYAPLIATEITSVEDISIMISYVFSKEQILVLFLQNFTKVNNPNNPHTKIPHHIIIISSVL